MILKEVAFSIESLGNRFVGFDVALTAIDYRNVSQAQRNDTPCKNVYYICSYVPIASMFDYYAFFIEVGISQIWTHIRSTFVRTPIVLVPSGSTSRAIFRPSELAKSVLAPVTARMIHAGFEMYL